MAPLRRTPPVLAAGLLHAEARLNSPRRALRTDFVTGSRASATSPACTAMAPSTRQVDELVPRGDQSMLGGNRPGDDRSPLLPGMRRPGAQASA
jgi:hypothetical protein